MEQPATPSPETKPRFIHYDRAHLIDVASRFRQEVIAEKHTENLKSYPNTFYGIDAVSWLVSSEGISRDAAVHVANQLQEAGLFFPATSDGPLKDKKELYQYPDSTPHKFLQLSPEEEFAEDHGACIACGELLWHDDKSPHLRCITCREMYHETCVKEKCTQVTPVCFKASFNDPKPKDPSVKAADNDDGDEASEEEDVPDETEDAVKCDDAICRIQLPKEAALVNGVITGVGNSKPLIVFINKKSGGKQGEGLLRTFRALLSPKQVFDLGEGGPKPGLLAFKDVKGHSILGCGGDGTIGWIFSVLDQIEYPADQLPPVAVLPLGTGNDLARVFGWGGGYQGEKISRILHSVGCAKAVAMDRWRLCVKAESKEQKRVMNNYMSVGFDAKIALQFHEAREANPKLFFSRGANKVWYMKWGTESMIKQTISSGKLAKMIEVRVDGKVIDIKDSASVIVLNIPSYSAGADLWGPDPKKTLPNAPTYSQPSYNDGLVEVVGINSTFHMGRIQARLDHGVRLGQGKEVTIKWLTPNPLACQVDGEPWRQPPCQITVSFLNRVQMLQNSDAELSTVQVGLSDADLRVVAVAMAQQPGGIKLQDKRTLTHNVKGVFSGKAAVEWLSFYLKTQERAKALKVGQQLTDQGYMSLVPTAVHHVVRRHFHADDHLFYRLKPITSASSPAASPLPSTASVAAAPPAAEQAATTTPTTTVAASPASPRGTPTSPRSSARGETSSEVSLEDVDKEPTDAFVATLLVSVIEARGLKYGETVAAALDPAGVFRDRKPVVKLSLENQEYTTKAVPAASEVWVWGEEFAFVVSHSASLLELEIPESGYVTISMSQLTTGTPVDQFWMVRHKKLDKAASFRGNIRLKLTYNVVRGKDGGNYLGLPDFSPIGKASLSGRAILGLINDANHRCCVNMNNIFSTTGSAAITGLFEYSIQALPKAPVSVYLQDVSGHVNVSNAPWQLVDRATTDNKGEIKIPLPEPYLKPSFYRIRCVVSADNSVAAGQLFILPPGASVVIFDVDGTLTVGDEQVVQQFLLNGMPVPDKIAALPQAKDLKLREGAVSLARVWAAKGYLPCYLSGRQGSFYNLTRQWLLQHGFPPGPVHLTDTHLPTLPVYASVGNFKVAYLNYLSKELKLDIAAAYGNTPTDIRAYEEAGIPKASTYIVGQHGGKENTIALGDGFRDAARALIDQLPEAKIPAPNVCFEW